MQERDGWNTRHTAKAMQHEANPTKYYSKVRPKN